MPMLIGHIWALDPFSPIYLANKEKHVVFSNNTLFSKTCMERKNRFKLKYYFSRQNGYDFRVRKETSTCNVFVYYIDVMYKKKGKEIVIEILAIYVLKIYL